MKLVRTFLFGTAASLVAVSAGHARPVEYVSICSLYGAGFYYIPGTDTCLKIGGFVRDEWATESNGNLSGSPLHNNTNTRATNNLGGRVRGYVTADAREQTAYGTIRSYINVGVTSTITEGGTPAGSGIVFSSNRAFIQWAGFTFGLTRSFFDFYHAQIMTYRGGWFPTEETGASGWSALAYTAQLGNGLSATLAAEMRRNNQIINDEASNTSALSLGVANGGYGGFQVPDIVSNVHIDQTWGSAQVMAASHEINPTYYGSTSSPNGHPNDEWGWVVGVGAHFNMPFITHGDYLEWEFNYTEGALKYLYYSQNFNLNILHGSTDGYGVATDCVYGGDPTHNNATSCLKTSGWSAVLGYEHYWTPKLHQSIAGSYMQVSYGDEANRMLCASEGQGTGRGSAAIAAAGCDNDWAQWGVGSRLQWDVTNSFYIGVEVVYDKLISARSATGLVPSIVALSPCASGCAVADQDNWAFTLRVQKSFLP